MKKSLRTMIIFQFSLEWHSLFWDTQAVFKCINRRIFKFTLINFTTLIDLSNKQDISDSLN